MPVESRRLTDVIRGRRGDLAAVALLALVTTAFFADVLFGTSRLFIRDITRYYYPTKHIIRETILAGEFPYWNPVYSAGQPMAANPEYEIFYPLQLLILLPNYDLGFRLHFLIHYYIAVFGFYALLRSMGLRIASALFGSISIALGGLYMGLGNLLPILFPAAWLPWTLLFARRLLIRPNVRDFALAGLFLGMANLVGEPTTLLQTWFLIGAYALYRAWYDPLPFGRVLRRNVALAVSLALSGALIGAVQILPAVDHVADSARSRPFTFELVTAWSFPWARPLELLFPNLFGHIYIQGQGTWFWAGGMYSGMGSPFLFSIYLGLLSGLLLVSAFFVRQRGSGLVALIALASALLALGGNTPLYRWLYEAHVATAIRYPEKFAFMGLVACGILAAMLVDRLIEGDERLQRALLTVAVFIFVVALGIALFSLTKYYANAYLDVWGQRKSPNARFIVKISREDWWIAATRCGAAALLVWMLSMIRRSGSEMLRRTWMGLGLAFLIVDVAPSGFNVLPRVHRRFFNPPAVAPTLDRDRSAYRVFHEADWYGTSEISRKFFGTADAVYWVVRNGMFPMTPATWDFRTVLERDYDKTHLHPTIDLTEAMWDVKRGGGSEWRQIFMAMSNARYYTQFRDFEAERKRIRGRFKEAQPVDFVRTAEYPRYYFADEVVSIRNTAEFVNNLKNKKYSSRVAFVQFPSFKSASGEIREAVEKANSIRLDVEAAGKGFLVLSVTPHKYWRATLDGSPVKLHRTNIGYQGVVVPAGRHTLEMRYRNPVVMVGGAISIAAILGLGILALRRPPA